MNTSVHWCLVHRCVLVQGLCRGCVCMGGCWCKAPDGGVAQVHGGAGWACEGRRGVCWCQAHNVCVHERALV